MKILLNVYKSQRENAVLLLDKSTSFVLRESELRGIGEGDDKIKLRTITYITLSTHSESFFMLGKLEDVINDIQEQLSEIITDEEVIKINLRKEVNQN